jgi:multicomponent Na+:H+ antiporter subunit D
VGVSLFASVLTLFSMTKIWAGVFWGEPRDTTPLSVPRGMVMATASLVVVSIVIAIGAEPLVEYAERAAADLMTGDTYRNLVLGVGR